MGYVALICIIGAIVAFVYLRRGETIRFESSSTPRQITLGAVGLVGGRRWQTLSQGDGSVQFAYREGPNWLVAIVLLILFLVPGIAYLVLAGEKQGLAVNTDESASGMTIVQVTSNGWRGKFAGRSLRSQFALTSGSLGQSGGGLRTGSVMALEAQTPTLSSVGSVTRVSE